MSLATHAAIARFLAAAHQTMLKWLKEMQKNNNSNVQWLREQWHEIMETSARREMRRKFFTEVLDTAKTVSHRFLMFQCSNSC